MAFASVNFALVVILLALPYAWGARQAYDHAAEEALANADETVPFEVENGAEPSLMFDVGYTPETAWAINIDTANFTYSSEELPPEFGDGTAYVFREGDLIGLTKTGVYQLRNIEPGTYSFTVSLHADSGYLYTVDDEPLEVTREITIEPQGAITVFSGDD